MFSQKLLKKVHEYLIQIPTLPGLAGSTPDVLELLDMPTLPPGGASNSSYSNNIPNAETRNRAKTFPKTSADWQLSSDRSIDNMYDVCPVHLVEKSGCNKSGGFAQVGDNH